MLSQKFWHQTKYGSNRILVKKIGLKKYGKKKSPGPNNYGTKQILSLKNVQVQKYFGFGKILGPKRFESGKKMF